DLELFAAAPITTSIRCEIRTTHWEATEWVPDDNNGWITYEGDTQTLTTSPTWYQISFSTPAVLTAGETYAIVLVWQGDDYRWSCLGNYANGDGFFTADGGTTWSSNGGESFGFRTHMEAPNNELSKVAWHESGDFAFAVTGSDNNVYRFTRQTGTWSLEHTTGTALDHFKDIVYDDVTDMFYLVGESNSWPFAYTWDGTNGFVDRNSPPTMGAFYGVEVCNGYNDGSWNYAFMAVGETTGGGGYAAYWSFDNPSNGGWIEAYSGLDNDEVLTDVAWDYQYVGTYYAVGYNTATSEGVVYSYDNPGDITATNIVAANSSVGMLNAIDWCPDHATNNYGLIVGNYYAGADANIWKFESGTLKALAKELGNFNDVDWHPDGSLAVLVGDHGIDGIMYQHIAGTDTVVDLSDGL
ncbi:MAG: WD40 repeat domain-containing protein, partial [Thermoplasmata archaeon]|nr:WD40 repeat domain-containing protein [Thermoplasmata archaeon]